MPIRFDNGTNYAADIAALRHQIQQNGVAPNLAQVVVSHPHTHNTATLHINMAFQANPALARASASIYTVAFGVDGAMRRFTIAGAPMPPCIPFPGAVLDGSYTSLGYAHAQLPAITYMTLLLAIEGVANYNGAAAPGPGLLAQMATLIVATSEAVRFNAVEQGLAAALNDDTGNTHYQPDIGQLHNWGGHTLG